MASITIDKTKWFESIEELLSDVAKYPPKLGNIEYRVIFDRPNGFFEIKAIGWNKMGRVHGSVIHIDVIKDKVLIRHNGTELEVKTILIEKGIPKESIILDFIPPEHQKYLD